jgi:hypothetical protein
LVALRFAAELSAFGSSGSGGGLEDEDVDVDVDVFELGIAVVVLEPVSPASAELAAPSRIRIPKVLTD